MDFIEVASTSGSAVESGNMECYYVNRVVKTWVDGQKYLLREEITYSDVPVAFAKIFLWSPVDRSWNSLFELHPASSSWMVQRSSGRIPDLDECAAEDLQTLENIAGRILDELAYLD